MATPISTFELLRNLGTGSEIDQAYQRQQDVSDTQGFTDRMVQLSTGIPTAINRGIGSLSDDYKKSKLYRAVDYLWGDEFDQRSDAIQQRRADADLLGGSAPGEGQFGELAADLVMFGVPTARLGTMASTRAAIASNAGFRGLAKGAAKDAAFNAATFTPADYALSKIYGLSDEEALINAVSAGAIGGLGSPVVSGVFGRKVIGKSLDNLLQKKTGVKLSKQQQPEIMVDGHYFPDDQIKKVKTPEEEMPTVGKVSSKPDPSQMPSEQVIRDVIEEPMDDIAKVLNNPEHPEFNKVLRREIYRDLGYARYTDDDILRASDAEANRMVQANARAKEAAKEINKIMDNPEAKEVYRQSILNKYTKAKEDVIDSAPMNADEAILTRVGGEPQVVKQGDAVPVTKAPIQRQPRRSITATPVKPVDLVTDRLRNIRASKDRQAADALRGRLRNERVRTPSSKVEPKVADSKAAWAERTKRPGSDEATVSVRDMDTANLGTERVYDGPVPPQRISPSQLDEAARARAEVEAARNPFDEAEFDNNLRGAARAKEATEKGYNKVIKSGRQWSRKEIDDFVKQYVPEDVQNPYKQAMIRGSQTLQKEAMERAAKARKGFQKPTGRDPMPYRQKKIVKQKADDVPWEKESKPAKTVETIAKPKPKPEPKPTGSKPGDVQAKIDAEAKAKADKLKAEEAKTQADFDKIMKQIESDKASISDLANKVSEIEKPYSFKLKQAKEMGYVPEYAKDVYDLLSKELGDVDIEIVPNLKKADGASSKGYYDPKENKIYIDSKTLSQKQTEHSIIHEAIHAATYNKIRSDKKLLKELNEVFEQAQSWFSKNDPKALDNYAFENIDEFIAESLSNPSLSSRLREIPYKDTTIWGRIKQFVMDAFGIKREDVTMYNKMNRLLEESIAPTKYKKANKLYSEADRILSETVQPKIDMIAEKLGIKSTVDDTVASFKASYSNDPKFKEFRELNIATREALNEAARYKERTKAFIEEVYKNTGHKKGDSFDTGFTESVLKTDFGSIREFDKASAAKFMRDNIGLYNQVRKYVNQTAKGMKDRGAMNNPYYSKNAYIIAKRAGLDTTEETLSKIDKMIAIKAMDSADWRFVNKYKGTEEFDAMMSLNAKMRAQSDDLFKNQSWFQHKGYLAEVYEGIYTYKLVDGEWVKTLDTDPGLVQGALPQALDTKTIGNVIEKVDSEAMSKVYKDMLEKTDKKFIDQLTPEEKVLAQEQYALSQNLGLVFDRNGNPVWFKKVASEAQRIDMGKSNSALDTIALTMENNVRKLSQEDGVMRLIYEKLDTGKSDLISKTPKKGMVQLTKEEKAMLPRNIRNEINFVDKDLRQMLLGNKEIFLFKDGPMRVAETVLKDMVQHFKENVVLKNPASWLNNAVFGFFMNAQEGISARATYRYAKEGLAEKKAANKILDKMFRMELKGQENTPAYKKLQKQLEDNLYYKMDREGLAVTVMNNVLDTPNQSVRFTDKVVKNSFDKMFGKNNKAYTSLQMFYLSPTAKTGQAAMQVFGSIDAMSRYSMVKGLMKNQGLSLEDAITKANSVYGDMDMIAPRWSQAIQQYGFVPFSNWFFRVAGGLGKSAIENPGKSTALFLLLTMMEEETGVRTESWNPLATVTNTPLEMLEMSPYNRPANAAKSAVMPSVYKKGINAVKYDDPLSIIITEDWGRRS